MKKEPFSPEQEARIQELYPCMQTKKLAELIGRSERSLYNKARAMGLKKSPEYLNSPESGRIAKGTTISPETRFKKGQVPKNKGKKMVDYMTPEAIERTKASQFRKGHLPHNTKSDNCISIRGKKKTGETYKYIRLGLQNWVLYHRYLWEQVNGPIPKGHIVTFINGDTLDCRIENLKLISMKENALRNSGSIRLADGYVVRCLAGKNKDLRPHIAANPQLIEAAKLNYKLNRKLKEHGKEQINRPE